MTCKKCGKQGLTWAQSKAGNYYLTDSESTKIRNENGRVIKSIRPAHRCEDYVRELNDAKEHQAHLDEKRKSMEEHKALKERWATPEGRAAVEQEARELLKKLGHTFPDETN